MFDQEFFEKIVSLKCSEKELKAFCINIDQKEFDTENAFTKYYRFDYILHCITLYQNKKISREYLTHWANAYNWIIMGGFKDNCVNEPLTLNVLLKWEISDWLDSLSFFDKKYCDIKNYRNSFNRLNIVYETESMWQVIYKIENPFQSDYTFLLINDSEKLYTYIFKEGMEEAFPEGLPLQWQICTDDGFKKTEQECIRNGYTEL